MRIFPLGVNGRKESSLLSSSRTLAERLGVTWLARDAYVASKDEMSLFAYSYFSRIADTDGFLEFWACEISLAAEAEALPVALDEDSYSDVLFAFRFLECDEAMRHKIASKLEARGIKLVLKEPQYLPEVFLPLFEKQGIVSYFSKFCAAYLGSSRAHELPKNKWIDRFGHAVSLRVRSGGYSYECYAQNYLFAKESTLRESARVYFEALDSGVDFMLVGSLSQFKMLDSHFRELRKIAGRDDRGVPLLFATQVMLLALGERRRDRLGLDSHKLKVELI